MKFDGEKDFSAEKELSEEECRKIVEGLGLDYLGIQEGYKKTPPFVLFTSPDTALEETTMGVSIYELTPENIQQVIKERLEMFKGGKLKEE
ncbi:hypothetical protein J7L24_01835 [bacterium]|nr:hypothetical protein [bacterium]